MYTTSVRCRVATFNVLLMVLMAGCGANETGPDRSITSGKVSYKGKPVAAGQIRFIPVSGPTAQGSITNGAYLIDQRGGVPLGKCKVELESHEETGKEVAIGAGGKTQKETVQVLASKYNTATTLTVEITKGKPNVHNFDLEE